MSKFTKIIGYLCTAFGAVLLLAILAMSLPIGGWRALSVQTGSMAPAIRPGALVLVHRVPESALQVGDVITYASPTNRGTTVTHRIVKINTASGLHQIIVKGDANTGADSPVAPSQIVGKVAKSIPVAGRVVTFTHKPIGLLTLVYLPALLIIIYELRLLIRRLTALEIEKKSTGINTSEPLGDPVSLPATVSRPTVSQAAVVPKRTVRTTDGLLVLALLVFGSTFLTGSTRAALTAKAILTGTTISTAPTPNTPPVTTTTSCTSTNSVNVTNTTNQTATSGSAGVSNSTTSSSATSGNASNSSNTSTTVVINTGCHL